MTQKTQASIIEPVALSLIVSLPDSGIVNIPEAATRELDAKHVEHLTFSNWQEWPPIILWEHPSGLIMSDGYHREAARKNQAAIAYLEKQGEYDIREKKFTEIETAIARIANDVLDGLVNDTPIQAEIRPFVGDREVIKAALLANTRHGKGLKSPVNQALAYFLVTRDEEKAPNQSQIADMFGVSRQALSSYIEKDSKKKQVEAASQATISDEPSENTASELIEETPEAKEAKKLKKAVELLIKAIENNPETSRPFILELFPILVTGLAQSFALNEDKEYTEALKTAIQTFSTFDMERLIKVMQEALKPEPKKGKGKGKGKDKVTLTQEPLNLSSETSETSETSEMSEMSEQTV